MTNLWTVPAEDLLVANDVALMPWLSLTKYSGEPEDLLRLARQRIEAEAKAEEQETLLVMTRTMAEAKYNELQLNAILGGHIMSLTIENAMMKMPSFQRYLAEKIALAEREAGREHIRLVLKKRFGSVSKNLITQLHSIDDQNKLKELLGIAVDLASLKAFRTAMQNMIQLS